MDIDLIDVIYQAILSHDTKFDGIYYVGIKSTGIFCRPSCRTRTPKKENLVIFASIEEAKGAGFRACKRCKPEDPSPCGPDALLVERIKELIKKEYVKSLTLADLAKYLHMSPYHIQRVFKRMTGITPAKYLNGVRIGQAKLLLVETQETIKQIARKVGFKSLSYFSSAFQRATGYLPSQYRKQFKKERG